MSSLFRCPKWMQAMKSRKAARAEGDLPDPTLIMSKKKRGSDEESPDIRRRKLRDSWVTVVRTPEEVPKRPVPKSFRHWVKEAEAEGVYEQVPKIIPRKHWVSALPMVPPEPGRHDESEKCEPEGPPGPKKPGKHWMKVMPSIIELPLNWGLPREQRRTIPKSPQEQQLPVQAPKSPSLPLESIIHTPKSPYRSPQPEQAPKSPSLPLESIIQTPKSPESYRSDEELFAPWSRQQTQEASEIKTDPFFSSNKVYSLNMNNFWQFTGEKDVALIMFYDPGNSSASYSKEHFSKAAERTKRHNHAFAAVDCSKEEDLCKWEDALQQANNPVFKMYSRGDLVGSHRNYRSFSSKLMTKYVDFCPVKNRPPCE